MSASNIKAGGAFVEIGIKDETRAALQQVRQAITQSLRETSQQANSSLGTMKSGSALTGIATDLASQWATTLQQSVMKGWSGALQGATSQATGLLSSLLGVKGLLIAAGATVALSLLPAMKRWLGDVQDIETSLRRIQGIAQAGASIDLAKLNREERVRSVGDLHSVDQVTGRQTAVRSEERRAQIDLKAAQQEEALLKDQQRQQQARKAFFDSGLNGKIQRGIDAAAGIESPEVQLEKIEGRLAEVGKRRVAIGEQLLGIKEEQARLEMQLQFAKNQEQSDTKKSLRGSLLPQIDALANDQHGELRDIENHRRNVLREIQRKGLLDKGPNNPTGSAGMEAVNGINSLFDLQARMVKLRETLPGLVAPDALQQGSVAAARQAEANRQAQFDPQIVELKKIQDEARRTREKLEDFLGKFDVDTP